MTVHYVPAVNGIQATRRDDEFSSVAAGATGDSFATLLTRSRDTSAERILDLDLTTRRRPASTSLREASPRCKECRPRSYVFAGSGDGVVPDLLSCAEHGAKQLSFVTVLSFPPVLIPESHMDSDKNCDVLSSPCPARITYRHDRHEVKS